MDPILAFWTPIERTDGSSAPNAYIILYDFDVNTVREDCTLNFRVYYNKQAWVDGLATMGNLPAPLQNRNIQFRESDTVMGSTDPISAHVIPGMGSQNLLNKLKAFIEFKLGAENVTWDE